MKLFARDSENSDADVADEEYSAKEQYESLLEDLESGDFGIVFPVLRDQDGDIVFRDVVSPLNGVALDPEGRVVVSTGFGNVTVTED